MDGHQKLFETCRDVLKHNDVGGWTRPAPGLYPHQWLWDSCFIAIGQRHISVVRAQREVKNLFRGQWKNGMIPNIIMGESHSYRDKIWDSRVSKLAPKHCLTSGITQPPMLAEAITRIGQQLSKKDRKAWYRLVFADLVRYHEWLYRERDPRGQGLVVLIHPWECGLDNNPAWVSELHLNQLPLWIKAVKSFGLVGMFDLIRKNTKFLPANERLDTVDALSYYTIARRLKRKRYDTRQILRHAQLNLEDLAFNSILIRANTLLTEIAQEINEELPGWLWGRMKKAPHALELLWSEVHQQYFSRNFDTFELVNEPSIATFLPLYAGTISKHRAASLVELLTSRKYWTTYPVPTVPRNSKYFQPHRYWQGPTWLNTNWLIIDGLERYGYRVEADAIRQRSLKLVQRAGPAEYFSPLDGSPAGARDFSWTAALTIDLLQQNSLANVLHRANDYDHRHDAFRQA